MWNILEIEATGNNRKFKISEKEESISNQQFLQLLKEEQAFRSFYNEYLSDIGFDAFFWENKPMTNANLDEDYECNIINTDFLAGKSPDDQTFNSYFEADKDVVCFPNLGNDARLIAPCPIEGKPGYTHIGSFIRNAPSSQIHELWKTAGQEMLDHIGNKPKWVSTSGLGVFWLHIRIDSLPKYYQTKEYKFYE